ncbi:dipeptidase PepV ['Catharanthus roseus' aster yellows phytoplasma]|uniref:Dipeptidase PepV n=1 Tax='Catharanthus roseus' aster yellows phytoplasma TaxID=1193712 RepID=A0A4V0Z8Y3_9MOLU|nr:dipeptidase PepV ['Catharanthus roseus' aster yellows phytoplasma]QBF23866.1 dipeptidase PepV ['Catharanthus roseus' aster yellows phytoplasma]QBF23867.1 dipeptidase PepV ['Catharanthus roseus' aster yellows phytoplasma]QBF23868.1 dipeptidase PepV ['Catharanthus roseus' aster yellows phytoplasma]
MIDFKKEVLKRKDALIEALQTLLKINTELTTFDPNRTGAPFGEGNQQALDFMLDLGSQSGFKTLNLEGYAGHIEYGNQKEWVGMIGHLDVVPAGTGWTYHPYKGFIANEKIYGRGAQDNKGPTIAAYFALKILKELKLPLSKRIKLILGVDEETGFRCMKHYFTKLPEVPVSGFVPDSHFPAIYCEKGIGDFTFEGTVLDNRIVSIQSGQASNVVPDLAQAVLKFDPNYSDLFHNFVKTNSIKATLEPQGDLLKFEVHGVSTHGSTPEIGKNALYDLMKVLKALGITNTLVDFFDQYLVDSLNGKKLGINHFDEETYNLVCFSGVLKLENNQAFFTLNLRYPKGITFEKILFQLEKAAKSQHFCLKNTIHHPIMYVDPKSELMQTLLKVYQKHTNDLVSKPMCVGGGSFAKCAPNLVPFGPTFVDEISLIHQKNESISIDKLITLTVIYTEALYELAK